MTTSLIDLLYSELVELLRSTCYKKAAPGESFKLASGKTSEHFIDVKILALDVFGINLIGAGLFNEISKYQAATHEHINYVAGVALGGCPLATACSIVSLLREDPKNALYVRKEPKDHGTSKLIEGTFEPGAKVALLEDVATTGGSSLRAIQALRDAGLIVSLVIAVVDREEGASEAFRAAGVEFTSLVKLSKIAG